MAFPLLPVMLGSMAISGGANLYAQSKQRQLYRGMANAYRNLDVGYRQYLAKHGRTINPDRAWTSYYGQYYKAAKNLESSTAGSVGTAFGTLGAGIGLSRGLYKNSGRTSRWL